MRKLSGWWRAWIVITAFLVVGNLFFAMIFDANLVNPGAERARVITLYCQYYQKSDLTAVPLEALKAAAAADPGKGRSLGECIQAREASLMSYWQPSLFGLAVRLIIPLLLSLLLLICGLSVRWIARGFSGAAR